MKKLIAIGDNCIDYYAASDKSYPGGNSVNVAVYYHRLGGESAYIGSVGTDRFGKILNDSMKEKGVDVSHVHIDEGKTALTNVELVNGDRVFGDYDEGVMSEFSLNPCDYKFISNHNIVVSGFWGHCMNDFEVFHNSGLITAFDFATKLDDPEVKRVCKWMDYSFFSYDENDEEWLRSYMKELHNLGSRVVVATRGDKGSLSYDGKTFISFGIIKGKVVDTIGAGDSYIAGFLYAQGEGKSIEESMKAGAESSIVTIGYDGSW